MAAIIYIVFLRGWLFDYLYERDLLNWYGRLIDFYNNLTNSGYGQGPHPLEEYRQRMDLLLLLVAMLMLITFGVMYMLRTRERRMLMAVNVVLIVLALVAVEMFLRTDAMQRRTGGMKYVLLDREISKSHIESQNSLGFTDMERSTEGRENTYRIAVLGDSFVWGDGLEYFTDSWSHRLGGALDEQFGASAEVLSWGKRGWSTFSQLNFLQGEGREFEIDFVLVGFVFNDPHIPGKSMPRRTPVWGKLVKKSVPFLKNTMALVTDTTDNLLYSLPYFKNWGYWGWQRELYSETNLRDYAAVLNEFQNHLRERNIQYLFVITPTLQHRGLDDELSHLLELFDRLEIPYLDLTPAVEREFGHFTPLEIRENLWANPADSHPSAKLHGLYANETLAYLLAHDLAQRISDASR